MRSNSDFGGHGGQKERRSLRCALRFWCTGLFSQKLLNPLRVGHPELPPFFTLAEPRNFVRASCFRTGEPRGYLQVTSNLGDRN